MCGLTALVSTSPINPDHLNKMSQAICHRGPDDHGSYVQNNVGLAHQRLSIVDLSERGRQPFHTNNNEIISIVNGEIYNYPELNQKYQGSYSFQSNCDSEIIGPLMRDYGTDFVEKLDGMFAVVTYEPEINRMTLSRDPMGIKPIYFYKDETTFAVSSEIKGFFEHPDITAEENKTATTTYLNIGYTPAPLTLFENIQKVKPGQQITFDINRWAINKTQYFELPRQKRNVSDEVAVEQAEQKLRRSVKKRLMSDVEIGTLLSGGLDSTLVTAYAQEYTNHQIKTFTIGFDTDWKSDFYNEDIKYGQMAADQLNTDHHELFIDHTDPLEDTLRNVIYHLDEPTFDATTLTFYMLHEALKDYDLKVALCGNGADELFGGYDRYRLTLLEEMYNKFPHIFRYLLDPVVQYKYQNSLDRLEMSNWRRYLTWYSPYDMKEFGEVFTREFRQSIDYDSHHDRMETILNDVDYDNPVEFTLHQDCRKWLADHSLNMVDKTSMAHHLEIRVPLLDEELVNWIAGLPIEQKVKLFRKEKWILRKISAQNLSTELFERKKQGLNSPKAMWLRGGLADTLRDIFLEQPDHNRYNQSKVSRWIELHTDGEADFAHQLWRILCYEIWRQEFDISAN